MPSNGKRNKTKSSKNKPKNRSRAQKPKAVYEEADETIPRPDLVDGPQGITPAMGMMTITQVSTTLSFHPSQMGQVLQHTMSNPTQTGSGQQAVQGPSAAPERRILAATGARKNNNNGSKVGTSQKAPPASEPVVQPEEPDNAHRQRRLCGNCGMDGHHLHNCVGPTDSNGMIMGCPNCNTKGHIWEQCSSYEEERHAFFMVFRRQNRPQLGSTKLAIQFEETQPNGKWADCLPWTAEFAKQYQADNPKYWESYEYHSNPKDDAVLAVDPSWRATTNQGGKLTNTLSQTILETKFEAIRSWKRGREETEARPAAEKRSKVDGSGDTEMEEHVDVTARKVQQQFDAGPLQPLHHKLYRAFDKDRRFNFEGKHTSGDTCQNCGSDHKIEKCEETRCGGCGQAGHHKPNCPQHTMWCVCKGWPFHTFDNCTVICRGMCAKNRQVPPDVHGAVTCNVCAKCGQDHTAIDCKDTHVGGSPRIAPCGCNSPYHLSQDHDLEGFDSRNVMCASANCRYYLCPVHCQRCLLEHVGKCNSQIRQERNKQSVWCKKDKHPFVDFGKVCPMCTPEEAHLVIRRRTLEAANRRAEEAGAPQ